MTRHPSRSTRTSSSRDQTPRACLTDHLGATAEGGEGDEGVVGGGGLLVAGGQPAALLEAVDAPLDHVAALVRLGVEGRRPPGRCARWRRWSARSGMDVRDAAPAQVAPVDRGSCSPCPPGRGRGACGAAPARRGAPGWPSSTGARWAPSAAWPRLRSSARGRPWPSQARCTLVLSPPRLRPSAWAAGGPPFPGPRRVLVGPDDRAVHAHLPVHLAHGVGVLLDVAQEPRPGAVPLPAQQPGVAASARGRTAPARRATAPPSCSFHRMPLMHRPVVAPLLPPLRVRRAAAGRASPTPRPSVRASWASASSGPFRPESRGPQEAFRQTGPSAPSGGRSPAGAGPRRLRPGGASALATGHVSRRPRPPHRPHHRHPAPHRHRRPPPTTLKLSAYGNVPLTLF